MTTPAKIRCGMYSYRPAAIHLVPEDREGGTSSEVSPYFLLSLPAIGGAEIGQKMKKCRIFVVPSPFGRASEDEKTPRTLAALGVSVCFVDKKDAAT